MSFISSVDKNILTFLAQLSFFLRQTLDNNTKCFTFPALSKKLEKTD